MSKSLTPKPVVVTTICSMCGLDWDEHGDSPSTEDCIRLLRLEISRKPQPCTHWHWNYVYPTVTPNVYPYINTPFYGGTIYQNGTAAGGSYQGGTTSAINCTSTMTRTTSAALPQAS